MDILIRAKRTKIIAKSERLLVSKYGKNALAAGALPRALLGNLQRSPRPLA